MGGENSVRVLVADDNKVMADAIRMLLEEAGFTVVGQAASGFEAVQMVQELLPDVVLMDIEMDDIDGIQATNMIYESRPTPVVVLTSHDTPELLHEASSAGVGAFLVKPTSTRELERAISIATARFNDIMELHRLNTELHDQNKELNAFAHSVAHDLKAPLQIVYGFSSILVEDYDAMPPDKVHDQLQLIESNALKMGTIIDELLLLAKIRREDVQLEPLNMGLIVEEALGRLMLTIEESNAEVVLPETWPSALGHAAWIEEVWANYISNALRYGGMPPLIELGGALEPDGMVKFWLRDNGAGIAPDDQVLLFKPFEQLGHGHESGHGLGLSIVHRIVKKVGGQAGVESTLGKGSLFYFTLPAQV